MRMESVNTVGFGRFSRLGNQKGQVEIVFLPIANMPALHETIRQRSYAHHVALLAPDISIVTNARQ